MSEWTTEKKKRKDEKDVLVNELIAAARLSLDQRML